MACLLGATPTPAPAAEEPASVPLRAGAALSGYNRLTVSVTICRPGTTICATIDNVMVDTGSTGLRLDRRAVPDALALPEFAGSGSRPLAECVRFVGSAAWGSLRRADLRIGGLTAPGLPIQIFEDDAASRPSSCPRSGVVPTSNGTLGIGIHATDCAGTCDQARLKPLLYRCTEEACTPLPGLVSDADRLPNPLLRLAGGAIGGLLFDLPAPSPGAHSVTGRLGFLRGGDLPPGMQVLPVAPDGRFTTRYGGQDYPGSYIDSGTATTILTDLALPACIRPNWAFCAAPPQTREATLIGRDGQAIAVAFRVGDFHDELAGTRSVSDAIASLAPIGSDAFVWGAPFFLGRRVLLVPEGVTGPGGLTGPLYAFTP